MTTPYVEIKTCKECRFYMKRIEESGLCRRHPPLNLRYWPVVDTDDWCGEFQDKVILP